MPEEYHFEEHFEHLHTLDGMEYERCSFAHCDLSATGLSGKKFIDCSFVQCNLSMAKIQQTVFRAVNFESSKLLGLHFEQCSPIGLSISFQDCQLDHSSFERCKLSERNFINCRLLECDFSGAELKGSKWHHSDLSGAVFENCNLTQADFSKAEHYSLNPGNNRIKNAIFSLEGLPGLLAHYGIKIVS